MYTLCVPVCTHLTSTADTCSLQLVGVIWLNTYVLVTRGVGTRVSVRTYVCIWECMWSTYCDNIIIILPFRVYITIVKHTKRMSSAPMTIHYSITKLHNMMFTTLWCGRMSLTMWCCTLTQVQGRCNEGWFVFWQEVDTQPRSWVKTCSSTDVAWRKAVPSWLYHFLCKFM